MEHTVKLYTQRPAPNPKKLDLYLAEKAALGQDIPVRRILINLMKGEQHSPAILAKNSLGRMPFVELDGGRIVSESLAIMEYFEERSPEPSLIGNTPQGRAMTRAVERSIDSDILCSIVWVVHATNSPAGYPKNPGVVAWFTEWVKAPLSALNQRLSDGHPFVAGPKPTIADCSLGAALQFARFGKLELLAPYEHLAAWAKTIASVRRCGRCLLFNQRVRAHADRPGDASRRPFHGKFPSPVTLDLWPLGHQPKLPTVPDQCNASLPEVEAKYFAAQEKTAFAA